METNTITAMIEQSGLEIGEVAQILKCSERTVYRWQRGDLEPREVYVDLFRRYLAERHAATPETGPRFRFIDLFAGIGGMRLALERLGGQCVFTSEWDDYCRKTYAANFDCVGHPFEGDITKVNASIIPGHDLLVAGFPCQPFSIAGVSKKNSLGQPHGFKCKTQGTLFFDVARIIESRKPQAFLLENVKNLERHDSGNTFKTIINTLREDLGYFVQHRVIDARGYVPQHRERIFIIGFREPNDFDLSKVQIPDGKQEPRLRAILHPGDGTEKPEPPYTEGELASVGSKYTLTAHLWSYLKGYAAKHRAKGNGFGYSLFGPDDVARTLSARYYKDGSEILIANKPRPRRLTPRECARLMGFDRPGESSFRIPVSDTRAYKQFGNAVVPLVVEALVSEMLPFIERPTQLGLPLAG